MKKNLILLTLVLSTSISLVACASNHKVENTKSSVATTSSNNQTKNSTPSVDKKDSDSEKEKNQQNHSLKDINAPNLDRKEHEWFFEPKKEDIPSTIPENISNVINKYSAYYIGDTSKKVIYLTFDEGYENGYTPKILDILKQNNVKAAFFVTNPYVKEQKDLIKRMMDEGHLVCNHTTNHPSMAQVAAKDKNKFENEITTLEKTYESATGKQMPKFFRPPKGAYSELSLYYTQKMGYKTIFWSSAYGDWDTKKQPTHEYAKKVIKQRTHNGAIILLHAVSKTNTEILDSVIKDWKARGYELQTLDKLP